MKALVPEMGEIDAVLQRAGLGSFSDALAGYGLEYISDLEQVLRWIRCEFNPFLVCPQAC